MTFCAGLNRQFGGKTRVQETFSFCFATRVDRRPDLFGGFLLMKQWGRIGAHGQIRAERYEAEALALLGMQRQAERKRRRGYTNQLDRTKERLMQDEVERIRL
jgi:predicted DNA-binding WGR domain protein